MKSLVFFCYFRYQFETFFIWKKAIIFPEKPTGQQMRALLNVFNLLIRGVYQKNYKNCIKTLKN